MAIPEALIGEAQTDHHHRGAKRGDHLLNSSFLRKAAEMKRSLPVSVKAAKLAAIFHLPSRYRSLFLRIRP